MAQEIQAMAWDRYKNVAALNRLMRPNPPLMIIQIFNDITDITNNKKYVATKKKATHKDE